MNIDLLKTFSKVVERGSFSAAARELGLSQPAVSMQMAALEEYFNAKLLYRTGRGVAITPAGQYVLELANDMLQSVADTKLLISNNAVEVKGELKIAASSTPGDYLLPYFMGQFKQRYPLVKIILDVVNTQKAIDRLLSGAVHLATSGYPIKNERIFSLPLSSDEIVLIAPPELETGNIKKLEDIFRYPLVRRADGSATRAVVERYFKNHQLSTDEFNEVLIVNSAVGLINAVSAGVGIAFVSGLAAQRALALKHCQRIVIEGLEIKRDLFLLMRSTGVHTNAERAFWNLVKDLEGNHE